MLAIGNTTDSRPLVYFVGLSAKPDCEHLAPETKTGSIIERIIHHLPLIRAVRTNLVKTPPIDRQGKLRYPNPVEMQLGWTELQEEMRRTSPSLLVTLGRQTSFFLRSQVGAQPAKPELPPDFSYESCLAQAQFSILSIHHPSFVYVYRRRDIDSYVDKVVVSIRSLVCADISYQALTGRTNIRSERCGSEGSAAHTGTHAPAAEGGSSSCQAPASYICPPQTSAGEMDRRALKHHR